MGSSAGFAAGSGPASAVLVPPPAPDGNAWREDESSRTPFVRYRARLYSHRVALARGMSDGA